MKTNLQQVREKVIEAVPDIMELKFGCLMITSIKRLDNYKRKLN